MNYFQRKGKLEAKYAFLLKKNLSLFVTLTKCVFFFLLLRQKIQNLQFEILPLSRKVLLFFFFLNSSNFSLIAITVLSFVFKNIHSVHSKITLSLKEVFRFYSFFLKRKIKLLFELCFYLSYLFWTVYISCHPLCRISLNKQII